MEGVVPTVTLNNGSLLPTIGLGTWRANRGEVAEAVKHAIDIGYRHFDCAMLYANEAEIGQAIKEKIDEGSVKRQDLFITSKLWCNSMRPDLVEPAIKQSLDNLGLEYLDLYLIHWPMAFKEDGDFYPLDQNGKLQCSDVDYVDTWKAMESVLTKGLTRAIGVSNFNCKQLKRLLENAKIIPAVNQVEYHPYLNQKSLLSICKSNNIMVVAYSPLGSNDRPWAKKSDPLVLEDPTVQAIAKKYEKSAAQVILRYLIQLGLVPIPKSCNKRRIEENINVFDFKLSPEDMESLDSFKTNIRYHNHSETLEHPNYPFVEA